MAQKLGRSTTSVQNKKWALRYPEKYKKYQAKNEQKYKQKRKQWKKRYPEKCKDYNKKYYSFDHEDSERYSRYVPWEDEIILDFSKTVQEIAKILHRSTKAIELRRDKLKTKGIKECLL